MATIRRRAALLGLAGTWLGFGMPLLGGEWSAQYKAALDSTLRLRRRRRAAIAAARAAAIAEAAAAEKARFGNKRTGSSRKDDEDK
jgi:hypothetical protein